MKRTIPLALILALAVPCGAFAAEVSPQDYYGKIARRLGDMLQKYHVLQQKLNDDISQKAWTNLVTFYDFDHSVFLKSDMDELAKREKSIDDELRAGDPSFGFDVYNLYCRRLSERMEFATNFLATVEWDFSTNETYRIKRKDAPWPETREEAEDHWRRRLKNEALVQILGAELDKSTNKVDAAESLVKKYRQYYTVLTEPDEEAVLQHYLSAVARAYDPHSDYLSPASKEDFDMEMSLTLCGVGAVLHMDEGALKIVEIMPGGPIDRDGRIKEGDKIVGVRQEDGEMEDIMWKPIKKSIKKIRGPKNTRVTLEIVPRSDTSGATKKLIELVRDEIKLEDQAATGRVETVSLGGFTNKVGYVYLPGFYGTMDKRPQDDGFRSCAMDVAKYLAPRSSRQWRRVASRGGSSLCAFRSERPRRAGQGRADPWLSSDSIRQPRRVPQARSRADRPRERVRVRDRRRSSPGRWPCRHPRRWQDARQGDSPDGAWHGPCAVRVDEDHYGEVLPRRRTFDAA